MSGMDMLLKSFGLDPEEIKKNVGQFGQLVVAIEARQSRLELKLNRLLEHHGVAYDDIGNGDTAGQQQGGATDISRIKPAGTG